MAHQLINTGGGELTYVAVSTMIDTDIFQYPDSGKFGAVGGRQPGRPPAQLLTLAEPGSRPYIGAMNLASLRDREPRPHIEAMPHLDLADEEAAALIKELHDIVGAGAQTLQPARPYPKSHPRQAQTGAGAQALAAAEGVCPDARPFRGRNSATR